MNKNGVVDDDEEEYVDVIEDYAYNHEGRNKRIYRNERYMVLQKRKEWWQVINQDGKALWAPCDYLRPVKITTQEKKDNLKAIYEKSMQKYNKSCGHDNNSYHSTINSNTSQNSRSNINIHHNYLKPSTNDSKGDASGESVHGSNSSVKLPNNNGQYYTSNASQQTSIQRRKPVSRQSDIMLLSTSSSQPNIPGEDVIVPRRSHLITKDDISGPIHLSNNNSSHQQYSSFKPQSHAKFNTGINNNVPSGPASHSVRSSSRHSLCNSSGCSSDSLADILEDSTVLQVKETKSNSFDDALASTNNQEHYVVVYGRSGKAASDEQLDNRKMSFEVSLANQLSYRNRSNSMDIKALSKEYIAGEPLLDPREKSRLDNIHKDRHSWRRSLALEESSQLKQYKSSLRGSDDRDVSFLLDNYEKPPKLPPKLKRLNQSQAVSKEDMKQSEMREVNITAANNQTGSDNHFKVSSNYDIKKSSSSAVLPSTGYDGASARGVPSSLIVPVNRSHHQQVLVQGTSQGVIAPPVLPRTIYACDASSVSSQAPAEDNVSTKSENFNSLDEQQSLSSLDSVGHFKKNGQKKSFKDKSGNSSRKGSIRGLFSRSYSSDTKESKSLRSSPVPSLGDDKKRNKLPKHPPSPGMARPTRELSEGWYEYWYPDFKCHYYYNHNNKEKRWKPPRKVQQQQHSQLEANIPSRQSEFRSSQHHKSYSPLSSQDDVCPPPKAFLDHQPSIHHASSMDSMSSFTSSPALPPVDNTARSRLPLAVRASSPLVGGSDSHSTPHSNNTLDSMSSTPGTQSLASISLDASRDSQSLSSSTHSIEDSPLSVSTKRKQISLPPRPPNSAKPPPENLDSSITTANSADQLTNEALITALREHYPPDGWIRKTSNQQPMFLNLVTGQKWFATTTSTGEVYFYHPDTNESLWQLRPESRTQFFKDIGGDDSEDEILNAPDPEEHSVTPPQSPRYPIEKFDDQYGDCEPIASGYLMRSFYQREGKKVRKNWGTVFARYLMKMEGKPSFPSGSRSLILFTKSPNSKINVNKVDMLDLYPPCKLDLASNKSSQKGVISIINGHGTEVLLRSEEGTEQLFVEACKADTAVSLQWHKSTEQSVKKGRKSENGGEELRRDNSAEKLNVEQWSIRDKLLGFIKRRPPVDTLVKKGVYQDAVFGSTIAQLCTKEKTQIPIFVLRCINAIERIEDNLKADGLYRISGNAAQIQKIRFEVAQNNYQILLDEKDVNNLTGALKLFFRELKEPLLPFNLYYTFIKAMSDGRQDDRQWEPLLKAVKMLPPENFHTLKLLLKHLIRVCEFHLDNRMSFMNLAIVFGPCLMWPESTTGHDLMTDAMLHNRVVEGLLSNYDKCVECVKR